ncbi:hypothetical protein BLA23254_01767 [Burkholderia lata]|uniref:Uncharacterized protein n=1 Tax=Burkholderia lata (strain ATCC 17760 / DSM 23089 / LMG 22485 / NCIMB 9086 / R18194 / 383) TaxID=482957 RepID=A0A6P2JBS1_BURL3|nr:hypothetical protein BLA23254_01767 [Burkholderia lata]
MTRHTVTLHDVFTLAKTHPEWHGFPVPDCLRLLRGCIAPILHTHGERISLRFHGTERYPARVADAGGRDAQTRCMCRVCAVVLSTPPANRDDCCNMRNNCCRT